MYYAITLKSKKKMDKIEHLMKMMESPDTYSETEWKDILSDKECQEYYQLMSKVDSAINNTDISDDILGKEWDRFEKKFIPKSNIGRNQNAFKIIRIAAAIIGILLISGIAYAALFSLITGRKPVPQTVKVNMITAKAVKRDTVKADTIKIGAQIPIKKQYDNATLESILSDLSAYYNIKVEYKSANVSKLRLFYKWDQSLNIATVVDQLNNFEKFHINLNGQTLTVE